MKIFTFIFLVLSYPIILLADTTKELALLIPVLEEKIATLEIQEESPASISTSTEDLLSTAYSRETELWNSITAGYDHLRSYDIDLRHRFLYQASRASAKPVNQRVSALRNWIKEQNHLIQRLGQNRNFYIQWNKIHSMVNQAISQYAAPLPDIEVVFSENKGVSADFLSSVKEQIEGAIASATASNMKKPELDERSENVDFNQYGIYLMAMLVSFLMGLSLAKSKKVKILEIEKNDPPPLPVIVPEKTIPTKMSDAVFFDDGVSLEEECRKIIEHSSYLLDIAQLKILPYTRSPFKTKVDAPAKKVSEALSWLLKGTLAIANSNEGKISHLEWHCHEQYGRVSLEFILHGLECDLKGLYLNTLIEGDSSAPAHFGRSEMALADHLASIGFKTGNKKTTISLGLDTFTSAQSH
jgi:hypothetical protein